MYKQITTAEERALFKQIYQPVFNQMNYASAYDEALKTIDLLVANKYSALSGTIQLHPFTPASNSTILESPQLFATHPLLCDLDFAHIYEVDKVDVLSSERKMAH